MLTYRKWTDGAKGSGSFVDNCKHNGLVLHAFINWLTSSQRRNSLAASGTHMTLRGVFDRPDLLSGEVISQLDTWSASPSGSSHGVCGGVTEKPSDGIGVRQRHGMVRYRRGWRDLKRCAWHSRCMLQQTSSQQESVEFNCSERWLLFLPDHF